MDSQDDFNLYFKSKRDQYLVDIRKRKNNDYISEKRLKLTEETLNSNNTAKDSEFLTEAQVTREPLQVQHELNNLAASFMDALEARDTDKIGEIAEKIRRIIAQDNDPPLQELINTGIVETIAGLLDPQYYQYKNIIMECSWIMANLVSSSAYTEYALRLDIVSKALDLFDFHNDGVKEHAVWIIANIAGESLELRDILIEGGIIIQIDLLLGERQIEGPLLEQISWLVCDLTRGKPYPKFEKIAPLLKWVRYFQTKIDQSKKLFCYTLWILSYLSDGDNDQIQQVLDMDICQKVIDALLMPKLDIQVPAIRTIGNLLTGDDHQISVLVQKGVIDNIAPLLNHSSKMLRREACWALSNILAGDWKHIDEVFRFQKGMLIKRLFAMIESEDYQIGRECTFGLTNACHNGQIQHIIELVNLDFIELLIDTIKENAESKLLIACLGALRAILDEFDTQEQLGMFETNTILERLAMCGGYQVLEDLQQHKDNEVYQTVSRLITDHFEFDS